MITSSHTFLKFCIHFLLLVCTKIDAIGQGSPVLGRLEIMDRIGNGIALINMSFMITMSL